MSGTYGFTARSRRVLLVLLTGAVNLSGYPLARAAGIGSGAVYATLARLEQLRWVTSEQNGSGRRFYRLTDLGREKSAELLGLEMPS